MKITKFIGDISNKNLIYILGAIGVLFLLISTFSSTEESEVVCEEKSDYCVMLEDRLEEILPKIENVGKVNVMITARNRGKIVPVRNNDDITSDIVVLNQKGGGEDIKIIEETFPEIQGVIIVAEGGKSDKVKTDLTEAVNALLNVETHKIKVFERNLK